MNDDRRLNLRKTLETVSLFTNNPNTPKDLKELATDVAKDALKAIKSEIGKEA